MKVVFFGSGSFGAPLLESIVASGHETVLVTHPQRRQGRGLKMKSSDIEDRARFLGCAVLSQENIRDPEFVPTLVALDPDLLVVADYGKIIPPGIIRLPVTPPVRTVNVHPSLLPLYRGATPVQSVLMHGETTTGVTLQTLSERLDAGDILIQEPVPVSDQDNYASLTQKLQETSLRLLSSYLAAPERFPGHPQDEARATVCRKLSRDDFTTAWSEPSRIIRDRLRALYPRGLKFVFRDGLVKVLRADLAPASDIPADRLPGQIVMAERELLRVRTSDGLLDLVELKPENRNAISSRDFINGYRPLAGEEFRSAL
jgi:methionyl-tRNA formyltransferase